MNNKKILMVMNEKDLKPTGGPTGYLYNVKKTLTKDSPINFLSSENSDSNTFKSGLIKYFKRFLNPKFKKYLLNYKLVDSIYNNKFGNNNDFSDYDIIHFHTTNSLFMNRHNLEGYKGEVVLTSHSPKPAHLEIIEDQLSSFERKVYKNKLSKLEKIDEYAFNKADYIFFPCEEAEEPYYNNWKMYSEIKSKKKNRYRYVPTGCIEAVAKRSKVEIREKYKIPNDAFLICYVGRHNETKGYDSLKLIAEKLLKKHSNCYFLIAGKEEPLKGLNHERWIEVGWTNDPHSIIASADLFLLPNKETYFDLILLEVLSLGKLVLATDTGGNKFFKKFNERGIFYFDTVEQALKQISSLITLKPSVRKEYETFNKMIYKNNFTMDSFVENYLKEIEFLDDEEIK